MALGKFTYQFCIMEDVMKEFIGVFVNPKNKDIGGMLTAQTPFQALYHSLMSLYRYHITEKALVDEFETLLSKMHGLNETRNDLIHAIWDVGVTSTSIKRRKMTATFSKGLRVDVETYTVDEINELTDQLIECTERLLMFSYDWQVRHPENFKDFKEFMSLFPKDYKPLMVKKP
jgi:hypothetical protein